MIERPLHTSNPFSALLPNRRVADGADAPTAFEAPVPHMSARDRWTGALR